MMNKYLEKTCNELAEVLKRQRGNQYGFGNEHDSPQEIYPKKKILMLALMEMGIFFNRRKRNAADSLASTEYGSGLNLFALHDVNMCRFQFYFS